MTSTNIKDSFEFKMSPTDIVLPQEESFIYAALKVKEDKFIVYCKNGETIKPNVRDINTVNRNIEVGYWKVIN